jgi:predicted deacylase
MSEEASATLHTTVHPIPGLARGLVVHSLQGRATGPTVGLIGAIHGDELEGPLALRRLMASLADSPLAGRLLIAPAANPDAMAAGARLAPADGRNLARCFPGDLAGTPTEAVAALITREVILKSDFLVDLHSGGAALAATFFAGCSVVGPAAAASRRMALAFGAPVLWEHATTARGRTVSVAHEHAIPAIYVECEGGLFPSEAMVMAYHDGVLNVLRHLGVVPGAPVLHKPGLVVTGPGNLDEAVMSPMTGLLRCHVAPLQPVAAGTECFSIEAVDTGRTVAIEAPMAGYPMFLRRSRWVEQGDLLMAMAVPRG